MSSNVELALLCALCGLSLEPHTFLMSDSMQCMCMCANEAKQLSRETASRSATGEDHPRFSNQMMLNSNTLHVDASMAPQEVPQDPEPPEKKAPKLPLAERLQDLQGAEDITCKHGIHGCT